MPVTVLPARLGEGGKARQFLFGLRLLRYGGTEDGEDDATEVFWHISVS
ncbi:MAG: hypothetical protein MZV65_29695 [Chromatiales bacterium]|nr:hypothetical protein [Chromatiales bacterium]